MSVDNLWLGGRSSEDYGSKPEEEGDDEDIADTSPDKRGARCENLLVLPRLLYLFRVIVIGNGALMVRLWKNMRGRLNTYGW